MTLGEAATAPAAIGSGAALPILVAAASPALRAGLAALLAQDAGLRPTVSLAAPQATPLEAATPPAAIVADLTAGSGVADDLTEAWPSVPLVLVGGDPGVDGPGLAEGPVAYLAADAEGPALIAAVHAVLAGLTVIDPAVASVAGLHVHARGDQGEAGEPISARERQVLELVAAGLPNKAIARELGISEHTVKFHVGSLLDKLGAASRTEAVTLATRRGILAI